MLKYLPTYFVGFDTEDDMIAYLRNDTGANWGGLAFTSEFPEDGSLPEKIEYKLRPLSWVPIFDNQIIDWFTNLYYPTFQMPGPRSKDSDTGEEPGKMHMNESGSGPVFCLLLGLSSGYACPITGQVTSVTWPVIGWA